MSVGPGPDPDTLLARFHRALVEEVRKSGEESVDDAFTVAEIYQRLVPYRTHRDVIGVEMNADYEDLLLRLLAGEGDYLVLESDAAIREIRSELRTPNPDTTLYRQYAAAEVRLNPEQVPEEMEDGGGPAPRSDAPEAEEAGGEREPPEDVEEPQTFHAGRTMETPGFAGEEREERDDGDLPPAEPAMAGSVAADSGQCRSCERELPDREGVVFCPYCGADQRIVPCPDCGDLVEPDWRFCVACGEEVGTDRAPGS